MKTSNKLIILALLWFVGVLAYDKILCRQEYNKIDKTKYFGQFTTKLKLNSFKHINIKGGNSAHVYISKRDFSGLQHRDHLTGEFSYKVNNDTLYIKFDDKHTGFSPSMNKFNSLIIAFQELESVTVDESYVDYVSESLDNMEFNIGVNSRFGAKIKNMNKLSVSLSKGSVLNFRPKIKSEVDTINVSLNQFATLDLKGVKFKHLQKDTVYNNTRILYWNRTENK